MLVEFNVSNFLSFKERQTFSMTAVKAFKEHRELNCIDESAHTPPLLRSAVIYGPNAGGKSNLLKALDFMTTFVMDSAKESRAEEEISVKPFLFDAQTKNEPSEFEITIVQDNVRYQYGFAVSPTHISEEWLYAFPEGRAQQWFSRQYVPEDNAYQWEFGKKLQGQKKLWQESTRRNALFLSTAVQLNSDQLRPVYHWFARKLQVITAGTVFSPGYTAHLCEKSDEKRQKILEFLQSADLGIAGIKIKKQIFSADDFPFELPAQVSEKLKEQLDGKPFLKPMFLHEVLGQEAMAELGLEEESTGSQNLFAMIGPMLNILENDLVLFIDELNNNLHPTLARFFFRSFLDSKSEGPKAQLICTTHEATLLDADLFRRDQVWFVEKDRGQATKLYPLSDFSPRKKEALGKGYLQGRYGALPYLGEWSF